MTVHVVDLRIGGVVVAFGRHNIRPLDTAKQMAQVAGGMIGKRLTYRELVSEANDAETLVSRIVREELDRILKPSPGDLDPFIVRYPKSLDLRGVPFSDQSQDAVVAEPVIEEVSHAT